MEMWLIGLLVSLGCGAPEGGPLQLGPAHVSRALAVTDEPVEIVATLRNTRASAVRDITIEILLPPGWKADPVESKLPALAAFTEHRIRFRAVASGATRGSGRVVVSAPEAPGPAIASFWLSSCNPLPVWWAKARMARQSADRMPEDGTIYIATGSYIVFLPRCGPGYGPGLVYLRRGQDWERVATLPALGHVAYLDDELEGGGTRIAEHWICPREAYVPDPPYRYGANEFYLTLRDEWRDQKGRTWVAKAFFAPTEDRRIIKCTHAIWCASDALLYRYEGPMTCVGDGSFGEAREGYHVPAPPVDPPATAPQTVLLRAGAVEEGVMAVQTPRQGVVGLLWDPQQLWTSGKAYPHALFASPNTLYHQSNQLMALLVPHFGPNQAAGDAVAKPGMSLKARRPIFLRSELFVAADSSLGDAVTAWQERFGKAGR